MLLVELFDNLTEKQIWGRTGKKLVRKYRCVVVNVQAALLLNHNNVLPHLIFKQK